MFKKLSVKTGFTDTEIKVLIFLLGLFLAGFIYVKFIKGLNEIPYKDFDYSKEENRLIKSWQDDSLKEASLSISTNSVKNNVLELNDKSYDLTAKKDIVEKSINLNTATKEELMKIKGIGTKTAENIILFREKNGKFGVLNDLMKIKGIGPAKFNKFNKYLYLK
jgi:competence protein ComEA